MSRQYEIGDRVKVLPSKYSNDHLQGLATVEEVQGDDVLVCMDKSNLEVWFHVQRIDENWF